MVCSTNAVGITRQPQKSWTALPKAPAMKETDSLGFIKVEDLCASNNVIKKMKRQPNHISDKSFVSQIYKELFQLNNKKTIQFKNGKGPEQTFLQRITPRSNKCVKRCPTPSTLSKREIKTTIKTTVSHQLGWLQEKTQIIRSAGEDVERLELSYSVGGNVKRYLCFGKQSGSSSKG